MVTLSISTETEFLSRKNIVCLKKNVYFHLLDRQSESNNESEQKEREFFHLLVHFPKAHSTQGKTGSGQNQELGTLGLRKWVAGI